MAHKPTAEQEAIIAAYGTGKNLVIEAGAGAGKTSTLKMLAGTTPGRRGLYVAYNKAIATDAATSFPADVTCKTAHSIAYASVGKRYRARLNGPRVPAQQAAKILGIYEPVTLGSDAPMLAPQQMARLALSTVDRFCYSADTEINRWHVPRVNGLDEPAVHAALAKVLVPLAQRAWEELSRTEGKLRFTHDMYLKMFALTDPQLPADYVLLDEAQDSNPCVAGMVNAQAGSQLILVGDRNQAIYTWRGARDAMTNFNGQRLTLSQSFRFGQAVADEANKWLEVLDAPLRLTGYDAIPSTLGNLDRPDAVLCRSNARAVEEVMNAHDAGRRAALVGGGDDIRRMAEAALDLQAGRPTSHPELFAFATWGQVQEYVQDDGGSDLKVFVNLIDKYGAGQVISIVGRLVDERYADVIVSTAHRAKGREWKRVRIADDFREPKPTQNDPNPQIPREDAMLAYVAVTRAQHVLDRGGLSWVDNWVTPEAGDPPRPTAEAVPPVVSAAPVGQPTHCYRCGGFGAGCSCDPEVAAQWSGRTGQPAGGGKPVPVHA